MRLLIKKILREEIEAIKYSVGCLIKCETTNRFFLLYRNDFSPTWGLMSGGVDEGETPIEALKREIVEELSINPNIIKFEFVRNEIIPQRPNKEFRYFKGYVKKEFEATLDHENLEYKWCLIDNLPEPLYPGLLTKIKTF
jgi:putative (di)nucleoside polyphosphate hydrolase